MRLLPLLTLSVLAVAGCESARSEQEPLARSTELLDNELVHVVEVVYEPGAAAPLHTHQYPRFGYALEAGVLELISEAGDTARVEVARGQTIWRPAETHVVRNVGSSTVRLLEAEIKTQ